MPIRHWNKNPENLKKSFSFLALSIPSIFIICVDIELWPFLSSDDDDGAY